MEGGPAKQLTGRQFDNWIVQSQKTLEMDPDFMPALFYLARAYHQKGKREEAIEIAQKLVEASGGVLSLTAFASNRASKPSFCALFYKYFGPTDHSPDKFC